MKKLLYPVVVLAIMSVLLYSSCKKPLHSNAPTPNNIRLMSYTATTRVGTVLPVPQADTTNENYSFTYDGYNRVTQILYTTNELAAIAAGKNNERITFVYSNDSVYKTIANTNGSTVFETDTFIVNAQGLVTSTYTPGTVTDYDYYGKLLARRSETFYNGPTSISASDIYTSDNGDFLQYSFNDILTVNFPTTMSISPYAMRDYWTSNPSGILGNVIAIHGVNTYTDELTNYTSGLPVTVFAKDTANDTSAVTFPGNNIWPSETYSFYTTMANRTGDYLQLGSFTKWGGYNIYQNSHLVKSISNSGYTTNITYNIDAYSKITQMTAVVIDSVANTNTVTYNLQYETF